MTIGSPTYRRAQAVMYDTASGLYRKLFPGQSAPTDRAAMIRAALNKLAESAPQADTILQQATRELQSAHANRFKAPTLIRAIFSSGTFTEGWAVYAERFMAEQGFGGGEVRMQQLKMRLRTIINALIDQGTHSGGMTEQQAMDLMMNSGYQERSEAAGKWRRASLTSTQLTTY